MLGQTSAIFLNAPQSGSTGRTFTSVTVHPVAIFSILDHFLRRNAAEDRVIGTILGSRIDGVVHVKSAFAVLHKESEDQVAVDLEYHRTMLDLQTKANPSEVIVGWYSTGSDLNTFSALIQHFYSGETSPQQAIHLAIDTGVQKAGEVGVKAYISSPVGVNPKPENCVFVPIPCELKFSQPERSGLDLLLKTTQTASQTVLPVSHDFETMEASLKSVIGMIDRVLVYVRQVIKGEVEGNEQIGKYLLDALRETEGVSLNKGQLDGHFHAHLQDTLMVSYLANLIRSQVEVSTRLALVT
ncbi:Mov34-domain-containing protein [Cantharellus anzutake]|uniref:Mov34-domain-containing protein n=1 Tax=Cantharellus anzutake TaxID=1750568 RepID=UPI001903A8D7|nr:Mov34-domain-containing protein [Cantharellus anzutake]KAF8338744.1 Mov34-domain-containing protein [Cantharellus anzutake]